MGTPTPPQISESEAASRRAAAAAADAVLASAFPLKSRPSAAPDAGGGSGSGQLRTPRNSLPQVLRSPCLQLDRVVIRIVERLKSEEENYTNMHRFDMRADHAALGERTAADAVHVSTSSRGFNGCVRAVF